MSPRSKTFDLGAETDWGIFKLNFYHFSTIVPLVRILPDQQLWSSFCSLGMVLLCMRFTATCSLTVICVCIMQSMTLQEHVYIHPSSILYHMNKEFIVYQSMEETSSRIFMKGINYVSKIYYKYCELIENTEFLWYTGHWYYVCVFYFSFILYLHFCAK